MVQRHAASNASSIMCIIHYLQNKSDKKTRALSDTSFLKIKEAVKLRKFQSSASERLNDIRLRVPEAYCSHLHGNLRWCCKNFTNISRLLKRKNPSCDDYDPTCSKRSRISEKSLTTCLLPADKCLFCDKNGTRKHEK